ncbi:MAG: hypothetical protein OER98_05295 [Gammaproteobacteria bacterium]|nr:hypothetical protein [Gammaproteobacteria bacterium]
MNPAAQRLILVCLLLGILAACSSSNEEDEVARDQKYYFLESLKQVEAGGRQLQTPDLEQAELVQALTMLDQGLKLAFQVERKFLDELDLRLGKNFQRYFVNGVENYRVGIEAGDEAQQQEGLKLLARWAEFWNAERVAIEARLNPG